MPIEFKDLLHILQAIAGTPAVPVVRLAVNDITQVKRALDIGAQTLMFPFVQNADEAKRAVSATRYPAVAEAFPGMRGFAAMHRGSRYATVADYGKRANAGIFRIIQLETPQAIERLEEIAAVDGVDALSAAMGHIGDIGHAEVQSALKDAAARARAAGKPIGIVGPTPEMVQRFIEFGYTYVAVASDMGMMVRQAGAFLSALRQAPVKSIDSGVY